MWICGGKLTIKLFLVLTNNIRNRQTITILNPIFFTSAKLKKIVLKNSFWENISKNPPQI